MRGDRYSRLPICLFDRPEAANWAIRCSCAVSAPIPRSPAAPRWVSPVARTSLDARVAHGRAPRSRKVSSAAVNCTREAFVERLRRSRATNASRVQLTAALETFRDLGARPWATRASHEVRATGLTHDGTTGDRGAGALTAQEHQIAMLAASGLSNKQIGSRLYLSPRTVGAHLYRVFPKLGITSRAALRDALSGSAGGVGAGGAAAVL